MLWHRAGMLVIQWILDATEFLKEMGPLVTEATSLLTLMGVLVGVVLTLLNRFKLNAAHKENTAHLAEIHTQVNGNLTASIALAKQVGVTEGLAIAEKAATSGKAS